MAQVMTPVRALAALERRKDRFGSGAAAAKLALLRRLDRARLSTAAQVTRLHELLCWMRAYPDDDSVLRQVRQMLGRFAQRADLRTFRDELAFSGIAGTVLWFPFFYPTARWIAARWPRALRLDRADSVAQESIEKLLPALVTPLEAQALREAHLPGFRALDRLRGKHGDAVFLIERVAAMPGTEFAREAIYDLVNPSCELDPQPGTPSRTVAAYPKAPIAWQRAPLRRTRPELRAELPRAPRSIRAALRRDAAELIDLARKAMLTRQRDLDAFAHGNPRDVWFIDDGDGLAFALIGVLTRRRDVLPAIYGGLTLKNGVPVGYTQIDLGGRAAALSFNTFETFRGGETAHVFARFLAAVLATFGTRSFSIEPYQLGKGNDEGLDSGAWWFYYKMGFRPRAAAARKLVQTELARQRVDPAHRTSRDVLQRLADHHLFFELDTARRASQPSFVSIGLRVGAYLAGLGSDRAAAVSRARLIAGKRCGLRSLDGWSADERMAWERLCPLIALLPVARWPAPARRALINLVRAKGAPSERDYVQRWAAHAQFSNALMQLGRSAR